MLNKTRWTGALLACLLTQGVAHAQDKFDEFSLRVSNAVPADRFFVRAGVISARIKSKSEDTYDVTGPVLTIADLDALKANGGAAISNYITAKNTELKLGLSARTITQMTSVLAGGGTVDLNVLKQRMIDDGLTQLGTPTGIKAVAERNAMTAGLSVGYYLGDDYSWVVEAYVLAKPIETAVMASGESKLRTLPDSSVGIRPFGLEGQKIISTKLLPPTVLLGRYWGSKESKFRLYTGAMAMYAIFYDTKATDALNSFVGGGSPGDTTVSLKNAFGIGPVLGAKLQINDSWHVSLNVGSVKLKTQGTLVTRNTTFTKDTLAIQEFGAPVGAASPASVSDTLQTAEDFVAPSNPDGPSPAVVNGYAALGGATGVSTGALAYLRGDANLGTYVRKANSTLQNTIFMLSVGRSF